MLVAEIHVSDSSTPRPMDHTEVGSPYICSALFNLKVQNDNATVIIKAEGKLDTGGSVSIANQKFLRDIKPCEKYGLPPVRLSGIGGGTDPLREVGRADVQKPGGGSTSMLCYVFNSQVGRTKELFLLSLRTVRDSGINILHHMDESLMGNVAPLKFWDTLPTKAKIKRKRTLPKTSKEARKRREMLITHRQNVLNGARTPRRMVSISRAYRKYVEMDGPNDHEEDMFVTQIGETSVKLVSSFLTEDEWRKEDDLFGLVNRPKKGLFTFDSKHLRSHDVSQLHLHEGNISEGVSLMTEIQLRRIVDKMKFQEEGQATDGDEFTMKDGKSISKFSQEAMELGLKVPEWIRGKVNKVYQKNVGNDSAFPLKNV